MTLLNIPIPDDIKARLETRAAEAGHDSVESYVAALIREDAALIDYGAPEHLRPQSREQLETLIREGLDSPTVEIKPEDWDSLRQSLISRHRQAKAG